MGRKGKQYTVQLTQNLDLLEKQRGYAYTATGVRVDVGLPKGHHAVLHEAPHPVKGWRVTHEESGINLSGKCEYASEWQTKEDAINAARSNNEMRYQLGSLTFLLDSAVIRGETYRRKLWEYAGAFVL